MYAILDKFPVSEGHTLIISKRHQNDYFDLAEKEKMALQLMIDRVKTLLDKRYQPDGYNIGMNCGEVAGQTVSHFHCHIIPRYKGDMENPKGGVRHCVEGKGYY
jgi:diadenosine tetraphosphate (Ap4A) HIT family hydrolase